MLQARRTGARKTRLLHVNAIYSPAIRVARRHMKDKCGKCPAEIKGKRLLSGGDHLLGIAFPRSS